VNVKISTTCSLRVCVNVCRPATTGPCQIEGGAPRQSTQTYGFQSPVRSFSPWSCGSTRINGLRR